MLGKALAAVLLLTGTAATADVGINFGDRSQGYMASISTASASGSDHLLNRPPESFQGQWFTTSTGCSYSRTQAPGYPAMWVLIVNPHHINQPSRNFDCATTL